MSGRYDIVKLYLRYRWGCNKNKRLAFLCRFPAFRKRKPDVCFDAGGRRYIA